MSSFEQIGVNYQYDSKTLEQAVKNFKRSCDCCCHTGRHIECDRCHIAAVHNHIVAFFADTKGV